MAVTFATLREDIEAAAVALSAHDFETAREKLALFKIHKAVVPITFNDQTLQLDSAYEDIERAIQRLENRVNSAHAVRHAAIRRKERSS
jgi:hypothetical protein